MPDFNNAIVLGRLTADPELKYVSTGTPVCSFSVAVSKKRPNKPEETTFLDVECWSKLAEVVSQFCKKGRHVLVSGSLKQERWKDKTTGQGRSKIKIVASQVQFIDSPNGEPQPGTEAAEPDPLEGVDP